MEVTVMLLSLIFALLLAAFFWLVLQVSAMHRTLIRQTTYLANLYDLFTDGLAEDDAWDDEETEISQWS